MKIDARELENNSIIEGDICIVGAGAAGISIAMEWMNTKYKVILLEGGGFEYEPKLQSLYKGESSGQKYYPLQSTRLHYFGGTTGHWGGMCSPLDEIDFKKRDWVEHSGWPITKKDLDPFYKRATPILELQSDSFELEDWQEIDPSLRSLPFESDLVWNKMWQYSPPTRFGTKYRDVVIDSKNIFLYTYANAVDIETSENVSNVKSVLVKNHDGKMHDVRCKYIILACGAIQNTRLLLTSYSKQKLGLGNTYDNVGRYFMEHIEINSAELWLFDLHPMKLYNISNGVKASAELAISENGQSKFEMLNGTASITRLAGARLREARIDWWTNDNPQKNSFTTWEQFRINFLIKFQKETDENFYRAYNLYTRIEQAPNPMSKVSLLREKDALGMPLINLHWALSPIDKRSIKKFYEIVGKELGINEIGRIKLREFLFDNNDQFWPDDTGAGMHHMGTTRMHNNPRYGVVDANCKVHNINNLFIAGSSCFPTSGAVNPTLTIVALSLRLSDHLKTLMKDS